MRNDSEIEKVLEGARLTTDPEMDRRILEAAGRKLPRRRIFKIAALTGAAAAALFLLVGIGVLPGGRSFGPEEAAKNLVVHQTLPQNRQEGGPYDLYNFRGGDGGAGAGGSVRLEAGGPEGGINTANLTFDYLGSDVNFLPSGGLVHLTFNENLSGPVRVGYIKVDGKLRQVIFDRLPGEESSPHRLPEGSPGGEEYDRIAINAWLDPRAHPLSTLSADVDTASYANIRRFLREGQLPPHAAVRVEEMINSFSYDYPNPEGDRPFSVSTEAAQCPWNGQHRLVRIGLQGKRIFKADTPPRNLIFLLDVSGSMESEDKLPLVKSAMKLLVGEMREIDYVGIVTYASGTAVRLGPTNGANRTAILAAIDSLTAQGSTNAGAGIQLAYDLAGENLKDGAINRVILATDGDFNVGITERGDLESLITAERDRGVFLTVLGVGTGNLKDSRMEMLADKGNGNYAYLDSILEAKKVLVREAGATLVTIAKDVKIQVEFNPARVAAYRLVGYENRLLAARDFNDDTKDAGEIGAGHSVTALFEVVPAGTAVPQPAVDPLRYQDPAAAKATPEPNDDFEGEMLFLRLRYKEPKGTESKLLEFPLTDPGAVSINETSKDFAFAAAVAAFGKILRGSPDAGDLSIGLVREIAAGALGADPHGDRKEFLELVEIAGRLQR
jgi:Ca-activated chloride channel homolog